MRGPNSLFGRIVQLVFARALETLLHTGVAPQGADRIANLWGQALTLDLRRLHEDGLDVIFVPGVLEGQFQRFHGLQDHAHRLNGVAVDDFLERLALVARISALVDELHLLQDRGLARLSRT